MRIFHLPLILLPNLAALAQAPEVMWRTCAPSTVSPNGHSGNTLVTTLDQGFILTGSGTDAEHPLGGVSITKMDGLGSVQWEVVYGDNAGLNRGNGILQASDGTYLVLAQAGGDFGDVGVENQGFEDAWFLKLDMEGAVQWSRCYGGFGKDVPYAAVQTSDGHYVVACETASANGDVVGWHGAADAWILKLDSANGDILWQECLGTDAVDHAAHIIATDDGGLTIMGGTRSGDDEQLDPMGLEDFWLIKLDADGDRVWQRNYGGWDNDWGRQFCPTTDGGYYLIGHTESNSGDVSGLHGQADETSDAWLVKVDAAGDIEWQRCIGGISTEAGVDVAVMANGGCVTLCQTRSNNGDVIGNHGIMDAWLARWSPDGGLLWQQCFGTADFNYPGAITRVWDDGIAMVTSGYIDDDFTCEAGDARVVRFAPQDINVAVPEDPLEPFPFELLLNGRALSVLVEDEALRDATVTVDDAAGRHLFTKGIQGHSTTLDASSWPSGAYLVSLQSARSRAAKRVVLP